MRDSEGFVAGIARDGRAEVAVRTNDSANGCHSQAEHCHCSEDAGTITIRALNMAGAVVGDYVSVRFRPGAIVKSVGVLLGIPLLGLVAGALIGTGLHERQTASPAGAVVAGGACFLAAVLLAALAYRRVFADIQPFIDRVIAAGGTAGALSKTIDPVCGTAVDPRNPGARIEYQGRPYYFCSSGCIEAFVKEPAKYLGPVGCARSGTTPA